MQCMLAINIIILNTFCASIVFVGVSGCRARPSNRIRLSIVVTAGCVWLNEVVSLTNTQRTPGQLTASCRGAVLVAGQLTASCRGAVLVADQLTASCRGGSPGGRPAHC